MPLKRLWAFAWIIIVLALAARIIEVSHHSHLAANTYSRPSNPFGNFAVSGCITHCMWGERRKVEPVPVDGGIVVTYSTPCS